MQVSTRAREWRVTTPDGATVHVKGVKVVITAGNALLFIGADREPVRIVRDWTDCTQLSKDGQA